MDMNRPGSSNIVDRRDRPPTMSLEEMLIQQVLNPRGDPPQMGQVDYTPVPGQPLGWDYDTLASAMDNLGYGVDDLGDAGIDQLLNMLEQGRAENNDAATPIIQQFIEQLDPHNQRVDRMLPMEYEDQSNGYWDAQNMGNGRGSSFMMRDGQRLEADPVGNGATMELIQKFLAGL